MITTMARPQVHSRVRVKICGNRTTKDISAAVHSGAHAIGLIVGVTHFSEDALSLSKAKELVEAIPVFTASVLVTHLRNASEILDIHNSLGTAAIQIHDDISLSELELMRNHRPFVKLIKAIHVVDNSAIEDALRYEPFVDALLLDSIAPDEDRIGGTGRIHDWSISKQVISKLRKPTVLAGGLTPNNVSQSIKTTMPFGVDVNSGVDDEHGQKDPCKVRMFVEEAMNTSVF